MVIARLAFSQLAGEFGLALKALAALALVAVVGYAGCRVGQATTPSGVLGRIVTRAAAGAPRDRPGNAPETPRIAPSGVAPAARGVDRLLHRQAAGTGGVPSAIPVNPLLPGSPPAGQSGTSPACPTCLPVHPLGGEALAGGPKSPPLDSHARLGLVGRLRAWATRRSAERAARKVEALFPGQLHLDDEFLIALGELPASAGGYRVGAKIPKVGGDAALVYDRLDPPWIALGGLRRAWVEVGPRWAPGGRPLAVEYGLGFMADGLRVWRVPFGAYATVDRDATTGELSGQVKAIVALDFSRLFPK